MRGDFNRGAEWVSGTKKLTPELGRISLFKKRPGWGWGLFARHRQPDLARDRFHTRLTSHRAMVDSERGSPSRHQIPPAKAAASSGQARRPKAPAIQFPRRKLVLRVDLRWQTDRVGGRYRLIEGGLSIRLFPHRRILPPQKTLISPQRRNIQHLGRARRTPNNDSPELHHSHECIGAVRQSEKQSGSDRTGG